MSANTSDRPTISAPTPLSDLRLIKVWLNCLNSPDRADAVTGLTRFARDRLNEEFQRINTAVADLTPIPLLAAVTDPMEVQNALFTPQDPQNRLDYHERVAAVVREAVMNRLDGMTPSDGDLSPLEERLAWWSEFHHLAAQLRATVRTAHDLVRYCGRTEAQAAVLLDEPVTRVSDAIREAERMLGPVLTQACGGA